jgi:hypothetical protein
MFMIFLCGLMDMEKNEMKRRNAGDDVPLKR